MALSGMKKVKAGAPGFHWIKEKYHKTTGKQIIFDYCLRRRHDVLPIITKGFDDGAYGHCLVAGFGQEVKDQAISF
ncbi:hypothetical protein RchiOBHm_Chr4g0423951 [Rosa chinensis]|uniref:Uncharacterized protein n=1 Tax=Rosa chinensis TaxID=74649 RepID=A0A2P6QYQ4_ROSCH|nr:hypothetical protein RchiOBHm_Chr4g0423951 [Rosa chinensis]